MFGINLKHSLATVAVAAGLLATAGSASAGTPQSGVVAYNGHAGLGASVYQHNQTDLEFLAGVTDGTSNTIAFGERAARPSGFSIDIGTSENIAADGLGANLMADMGGQFSRTGPSADGIIAVLIGL
jgi:hypothetical protein